MARQVVLQKALTAADDDNIALAQAVAGAGNLTLSGVASSGGVATLDGQRRVLLSSSGNDTGISFTVYGTNDAGVAISEAVTGGNGTGVATSQDFKTVTRIAASGAVAGTIKAGTNTTGSTPWFVPNMHVAPFEIGAAFEVVSGTVTGSCELTDDSVLMPIPIYQTGYSQALPVPTVYAWPGLSAVAVASQSVINHPCQGIRLTVTSGTGTARLALTPSGMRGP